MATLQRSPLAPERFTDLSPLGGVSLATAACGVRYTGRQDVLLIQLSEQSTVGGVFTRSSMPGAPVSWCKDILHYGKARALVVNSGNANVFTGRAGYDAAAATAKAAADALSCEPEAIYLASTGVIGEPLPYHRITDKLPELATRLQPDNWQQASEAIMTTDTYPKRATRTVAISGKDVTIHGIAKGSGMIAPDMATMLAFIFTDATLPAPVLQALLREYTPDTFNAITVDSDTSTSDMVLLFATGAVAHTPIASIHAPELTAFREALHSLMLELALMVVRDGEGATKCIRITVEGAESNDSARRIARSIADSPLVKTAIAGEDANWGRIIMAIGKSGEPADRDRLRIAFGEHVVAEQGARHPSYSEEAVSAYMRNQDIVIATHVGVGDGHATLWTCDLTATYIAINADYRS